MTVKELIDHLNEICKDQDSLIAIDIKINGDISTRSEISNINLYGKEDKGLITLETKINMLGSVDTNVLVNKRLNELIDAANNPNDDGILI